MDDPNDAVKQIKEQKKKEGKTEEFNEIEEKEFEQSIEEEPSPDLDVQEDQQVDSGWAFGEARKESKIVEGDENTLRKQLDTFVDTLTYLEQKELLNNIMQKDKDPKINTGKWLVRYELVADGMVYNVYGIMNAKDELDASEKMPADHVGSNYRLSKKGVVGRLNQENLNALHDLGSGIELP